MIKEYKNFFLSDEMVEITPYAQSIIDDDVEAFVQAFEPFSDEDLIIDPIEIAAAYNSVKVFDYLLNTYDYSDYFNPFRITLPVALIIFERESLLFDALEQVPFTSQQFLVMYEYIIQSKDLDYFKQFFEAYGIATKERLDLMRIALSNKQIFDYLISIKTYKGYLKHEDIVYEIISYYQEMLDYIAFIDDLSTYFDNDDLLNILKIDDEPLFKRTIDFIVDRHIDLNAVNEFGLTFFHEALRHARYPSYVYYLFDKGANPFFKTDRGFPSSHQLLFRGSDFTLELSRIIDFDAKDLLGLTLKDYDRMQRKTNPQLLDILLVVKLVLNMDESAVYELERFEFFDLAHIHGFEPFDYAYSVLIFESSVIQQRFNYEMGHKVETDAVHMLKETLQDAFIYDQDTTLELIDDILDLDQHDFKDLRTFAKENKTTLKIATDGALLNKSGHLELTFTPDGDVVKQATLHTNFVDVYYVHKYFGVPLENITYTPKMSKSHRFLN